LADETAVADQPQSSSIFDELDAEESQSSAGEEPGASADEQGQSVESDGAQAGEASESEESYQLPDEQSKDWPLEEIEKFGLNRYGYTKEEIAGDPRLRNSLRDQLNSAILINKQKQAEVESEEEPTLEEDEAVAQNQPVDQAQARQQYFQNLERFVTQNTDKDVAEQFAKELASVSDPKTGKLDGMKLATTFGKFGVNLINTALPVLLKSAIAQLYPELDNIYAHNSDQLNRPMYQEQWTKVKDSDPNFANLPAYGTPEFRQWSWENAQKIPNFQQMTFVDDKGKPLSKEQTAYAKYNLLAKIGSGQRVTSSVVKEAVETGKKQAQEAQRKRLAGNLGAGQSKGKFAAAQTGNDDIFGKVGEVQLSRTL
jgi:hypothetical protein